MRLSSEVVDLRGPDGTDDLDETVAVDEVAVVKNHFPLPMAFRIFVEMLKKKEKGKKCNGFNSIVYTQAVFKPDYSCYSRDPKSVVGVDRRSLFRGCYVI